MTPEQFCRLRDYVYKKSGMFFEEKKAYFVEKRVYARMESLGISDFDKYFCILRFDPSGRELQELLNALTVNETYFFREFDQLKCFAEEVLPEIVENKNGQLPRKIRVWSAGCSTGEEPYTLAIILKEMLDDLPSGLVDWEVCATDINNDVIEKARRGVYSGRSLKDVPLPYLQKYFIDRYPEYEVRPEIRSRVTFAQGNLLDMTEVKKLGTFDAVFCRNVLIYFDDASRRQAALNIYQALRPGGFVFLGHAESMSRISPIFKIRKFAHAIVYQK